MKRFIEMPLTLKITVIYFSILAIYGIINTIITTINLGPVQNENIYFQYGYKSGFFVSRAIQYILLLIVAFAVYLKKQWVMKFSIFAFIISIIYDGYSFATGFSKGSKIELNITIFIFSYTVIIFWYLLWLYFIRRNKAQEYYNSILTTEHNEA
jgi:hypothetical protein